MVMSDSEDTPFDLDEQIDNVVNLASRRAALPPSIHWASEVLRAKDSRIVENIPNALLVLAKDPRWSGVLAWNEFERKVFVRRELPWLDAGEFLDVPRPLSNHDLTHVQMWLQNEKFGGGMWTLGADAVFAAVNILAQQYKYHPVKEIFAALPEWDGVPRADTWLVDIFGVADTPYARMVGKMFLLGMLRRILTPGCKMDYMLILEGLQGMGKSTACELLCYNVGYGVAQFKSLDSVDTSIFIRNKWVVEFGEMHALRKAEVNELKLWLVKAVEDYRPKYGRANEHEPRQTVFIGTSNASEYLNDPTGGRRFWPVHCSKIDLEMLVNLRDQLWAEIVVCEKAGEAHYPDPAVELEHFAPEQKARMVEDPWEPLLFPAIERMNRVTQTYICSKVGILPGKLDRFTDDRIKAIFNKHQWKRGRGKEGVYFQNPVINTARTMNNEKK